jgi:hypothetical protein
VDVMTGLYVVNFGKFDISDGSFTVDCYLTFKDTTKSKVLSNIDYEFMNGASESSYVVDDLSDKKVYRVKSFLSVPVDLKEFPFEKHAIKIIIEDKRFSKENINFIADKSTSGLDKAVFIPGYTIDGWNVAVYDHYYDVFNESYSQFVFTIDISKPVWNAFQKTLLPAFCMVLVVLLSFLISKDMIENRIATITSGLLGVIMFHSSIASQLPPIGYLTFADKIMLISYAVIIISLLINIVMLRYMNNDNQAVAEKIYSKTKYNILLIYIVIVILYCIMNMRKV